jgi:ATP-binding cassette, subfamily B, bacterial
VPVAGTAVMYLRNRRHWADARLHLTHSLVERMVGHQTRLAQEPPDRRHDGEDAELAAYHAMGRAMDPWLTRLSLLASRGWLPIGLAALMPAFIWGGGGQVEFAIGLGAVLLAQRAFTQFANSCTILADAVIGWRIVGPLSAAAVATPDPTGAGPARGRSATTMEERLHDAIGDDGAQPLLEGHGLRFAYDGRPTAVLDGCNFVVRRGDRILLEGGSGSGKSTLAAVLAGLRPPAHGLLLLDGLDFNTLGAAEWQRRIALVPQFHENHILSGTLAFNVLMGRGWPASDGDLALAYAVLCDLELGPLLERMPNGLHQTIGETGWQLSHGERSRVYLARALLQGADLLILDESFAALDPETLEACWRVLLARQQTIVVIAHP